MAAGLEEEVRRLVETGYGFELPAMSGVGYGQFVLYLAAEAVAPDGAVSLEQVVQEIKRATRRFVRHQGNWFRATDPRIRWFEAIPDPYDAALELVQEFLASLSSADSVVQ